MKVLIVVDMQNDFISGSLGTKEAERIVPNVVHKIRNFDGRVICTRDTHQEEYLLSQEGTKLPVPHCVRGTRGWELQPEIAKLAGDYIIDKPTFGSAKLGEILKEQHENKEPIESIELVGLCTDICVISNALLLKAFLPEVPIFVDASCCAGVTPESHKQALEAMKMCQITIVNEG